MGFAIYKYNLTKVTKYNKSLKYIKIQLLT